MISFIFYSVIFAFFAALVVGTLGDEIQDLLRKFIDRSQHPEFSPNNLPSYSQAHEKKQRLH